MGIGCSRINLNDDDDGSSRPRSVTRLIGDGSMRLLKEPEIEGSHRLAPMFRPIKSADAVVAKEFIRAVKIKTFRVNLIGLPFERVLTSHHYRLTTGGGGIGSSLLLIKSHKI